MRSVWNLLTIIQVRSEVGLLASAITPEWVTPLLENSEPSQAPYSSSPVSPTTLTEAPSDTSSRDRLAAPPGSSVSPT